MVDLEDWRVFILVICDQYTLDNKKASHLVRFFVSASYPLCKSL